MVGKYGRDTVAHFENKLINRKIRLFDVYGLTVHALGPYV